MRFRITLLVGLTAMVLACENNKQSFSSTAFVGRIKGTAKVIKGGKALEQQSGSDFSTLSVSRCPVPVKCPEYPYWGRF